MSNRAEIQQAIEQLPRGEVVELAMWLERKVTKQPVIPSAAAWLEKARGAAKPGVATADIMALTRGEM